MNKAFAAMVMIALTFTLVGCAGAGNSEVEFKVSSENNIGAAVQWEVTTSGDFKTGDFEGKTPKTIKAGSFEGIESVYASAHRLGNNTDKLTLELIVDGETVDKGSTKEKFEQVIVEYSGE